MRTIWKFPIPYELTTHAEFPLERSDPIVHVALDPQAHGTLALWIEVDPTSELRILRRFKVIGTGHPIPDGGKFVGTVIDGQLVLHVFEVL